MASDLIFQDIIKRYNHDLLRKKFKTGVMCGLKFQGRYTPIHVDCDHFQSGFSGKLWLLMSDKYGCDIDLLKTLGVTVTQTHRNIYLKSFEQIGYGNKIYHYHIHINENDFSDHTEVVKSIWCAEYDRYLKEHMLDNLRGIKYPRKVSKEQFTIPISFFWQESYHD